MALLWKNKSKKDESEGVKMDTTQPREISVIEPIGAAIEKTKQILFQPFDIGKWFIIGVSAWLATLGQRGGVNFQSNQNFSFGDSQESPEIDIQHEVHEGIQEAKQFFLENAVMFITLGVIFFLLCTIIILFISWIKSRSQFIYLDCVAKNKAEFFNPWKNYSKQGNSLFLFQLSLWLISIVAIAIIITSMVFLIVPMAKNGFEPIYLFNIGVGCLLVLVLFFLSLFLAIVKKLTIDFVVPVMYLHRMTVIKAWQIYSRVLRSFKGSYTLYILVSLFIFFIQITFWVSLGIITIFGVCCCFIPCCFTVWFYLPYIGVVLTLPWYVWKRSYSALFLAQFGPEFDVFVPTAAPVVVPTDSIPPAPPGFGTGDVPPQGPEQDF